ncbi:N,N'-diacetylchitobiose transport system substrate-binding protein [Lentzea fradiae]|uniref:N,N'-diacetylchitobiose transport system substrate-binding protein n=1 Tax=Lentzea fradiae TaxID=200378 RepID=A0A1G7YTU8_9PSEU|nr:extracellular solute-binding protein [Lentzea fradiae]SDG99619.1 N,N'-diacetylchitobiose transport system substrate-binding protein [Lentzea fradiae]
MRLKTIVAVLGVGAVVACAPVQSGPASSGTDEQTGQLRVWLFDEVNRGPKEAVVKEAVSEFQAAHSGVTVDVQYIQVASRAERFKAAFSDQKSAPDVAEFGNTDLAGFVSAGGFSELDLNGWEESKDLVPTILDTAKVDGKTYGVPWFVGVRALYYRTDVFDELGIDVPETLDEIATTAREIRQKKPEMIGISAGGKYLFAALPYIWAQGGDIAKADGGKFTATIDSAEAKAGVAKYTELIKDDICPPATCAGNGGDASVEAFRAGKAAMTIGGDFNRKSVDASSAAGKYGVVPLPGKDKGSIAPAFAGGNLLGVMKGTQRKTLATEFTQLLASKKYQQKMYTAMGNLPTFADVQQQVSDSDKFLEPFTKTLQSGTRFVPVTPAWAKIDAQAVVPTMIQEIVTGAKDVDTATADAAKTMNAAFTS